MRENFDIVSQDSKIANKQSFTPSAQILGQNRSPQKPRRIRQTQIARRIKDYNIRTLEEHVPMNQGKRDQDYSALSLDIATIEYTQRQSHHLQKTFRETQAIAEEIQKVDYLSNEQEKILLLVIRATIERIDEIKKWVEMVPEYEHCRSINASATTTKNYLIELKDRIIDEDIGETRLWISIMIVSLDNLESRIRGLCDEVISVLKQEGDIVIENILISHNYVSNN